MTLNQERDVKLGRLREFLQKHSLDGVYLKRQDNFAWLTCGGINYVGLGDMGNAGLLVTKDAQYAVTNTIEASRMKIEEKLEEMGFPIHASVWHDLQGESNILKKLVPGGKLGFDHGNGLGENLTNDLRLLRFSLTEAEIQRYKEAGYLTALAMEETIAETRPGDTEHQVIGRLVQRIRGVGMDCVSAMCAADNRISDYRHPVPTEQKIQKRVQLGGNIRYKGLIVCCTRNRSFGPISAELREQYRKTTEIDCVLMANSIPGKTFVYALEAGKKAYEAMGYGVEFDNHHQGGPIGYQARDYRVDFATPGVIHENQAFCWNPSITGTKSEDTVLATSKGIVPLSNPILLPTITLEVAGQTFVRPAIWEA